jgi:predicted O-methyltransferase YrrM
MKELFYDDLLFGYKISLECDYYFPPREQRYEQQWKHLNKGLDVSNIKPNCIIYADLTWIYVFGLFSRISVPFILVTSDNDFSVPYINSNEPNDLCLSILDNPSLIHWFSVNVDFDHPKLSCIPIGLPKHIPMLIDNSFMGWSVGTNTNSIEYYTHALKNLLPFNSVCDNILNNNKELLYCKMSVITSQMCNHPFQNIRENAIDILKKYDEFSKCMTESINLLQWPDYIKDLLKYKFCLSLFGRGYDCYRTWEALCCGVIPVVVSSPLDVLYDGLPVVIVTNLEDITPAFLEKQYELICGNIDTYKWERLSSSYWVNIIKDKLKTYQVPFEGQKYRTSENWFNYVELKDDPIRYLEIGTFYGANLLSVGDTYGKHDESELYCIDPWIEYDEYQEYKSEQSKIYETFQRNVNNSVHKNKIKIHRGFSNDVIPTFSDNFFDIIYIDGNHEPEYVLEDAVLSFRKLKKGGYLIFDDYGWGGPDLTQRGIDGFMSGYHKKIKILGQHNTQMFVKKL